MILSKCLLRMHIDILVGLADILIIADMMVKKLAPLFGPLLCDSSEVALLLSYFRVVSGSSNGLPIDRYQALLQKNYFNKTFRFWTRHRKADAENGRGDES